MLTTLTIATVIWLVLITVFRRKAWGVILWLPLFLGLSLWLLFAVAPLLLVFRSSGPDAGWGIMAAMFSLMANSPLIMLWGVLIFCRPPKGTTTMWMTLTGLAITPLIYFSLYAILTERISLQTVDQDGKAISSCSIQYSLMSQSMLYIWPIRGYGLSNPDGILKLRAFPSQSLAIESVSKAGYELEPGIQRSYSISTNHLVSPIRLRMWSDNIHEKLITGVKSFEIVPDGRTYFINLTNGSISESGTGDLKVWVQYTNHVVQGQLYDWSAGIAVINGGLLEVPQVAINSGFSAESPFAMYTAPTDGYIPSFTLKSQSKADKAEK